MTTEGKTIEHRSGCISPAVDWTFLTRRKLLTTLARTTAVILAGSVECALPGCSGGSSALAPASPPADGYSGSEAQSTRLPRREGKYRVAVREQHLAVGHPDGVVAETLGVAEEPDLIHVRHHANGKAHVVPFPTVSR